MTIIERDAGYLHRSLTNAPSAGRGRRGARRLTIAAAGLTERRVEIGWGITERDPPLANRRAAVGFPIDPAIDHDDAIPPGTRILVADDLLATGGTARAMCQLVENAGGTVAGVAFLIELSYLSGRDKLQPYKVVSLITYDDPQD